jgi:hypothetical protein
MRAPSPPSGPSLTDIVDAAVKASPPAAVVLWNRIAEIPAEKWLTYALIGYTLLQALVLLRKEFFKRRGRK